MATARRLAEAVPKESAEPCAAIAEIARRVLLRPLSGAETEVVMQTAGDLQQQFTANPESAKPSSPSATASPTPPDPAPQLAALTMVASQILNLDEALNK
jgi:hypothetical protein